MATLLKLICLRALVLIKRPLWLRHTDDKCARRGRGHLASKDQPSTLRNAHCSRNFESILRALPCMPSPFAFRDQSLAILCCHASTLGLFRAQAELSFSLLQLYLFAQRIEKLRRQNCFFSTAASFSELFFTFIACSVTASRAQRFESLELCLHCKVCPASLQPASDFGRGKQKRWTLTK